MTKTLALFNGLNNLVMSGFGSAAIKTNRVLIAILSFSAFIIPVTRISAQRITQTNVQVLEVKAPPKIDTLRVLNGRLNVLLKTSTFTVVKTDQLMQMYSASFKTGKVLYADGFRFGENSTLLFYQTNIENFATNDGDLSTWKLIESFTEKIPKSEWIESGWQQMRGGFLYFVKLVSYEKRPQFFKFVFFYIDNKLTFSLFQCPMDPLQTHPIEPEKYLSIVANDPHLSRFTGFERK